MTDVLGMLSRNGVAYRNSGPNDVAIRCPECGRAKKVTVNVKKGQWHCWHPECGAKGSYSDLSQRLREPTTPGSSSTSKPSKKPRSAGKISAEITEEAVAHLGERGIQAAIGKRFNVRFERGYWILPHYLVSSYTDEFETSIASSPHNIKRRSLKDKHKMSQEPGAPYYPYGLPIPAEKTELIVVEGEFDCMVAHQLGFTNTVSWPHGVDSVKKCIDDSGEFFDHFEVVYLAGDMDEDGERACEKAAELLGRWRCRRVELPEKDLNDWLLKGTLTPDRFGQRIMKSRHMAPPSVRSARTFRDEILADDPPGFQTGFERFDSLLGGLRPGELTILTGMNGVGKTTLLNQITLNLLSKYLELTVGMASMEMLVKWLMRWMVKQNGLSLSVNTVDRFLEEIGDRLQFIDRHQDINPATLIGGLRYNEKAYRARVFVIDSMLRVDLGVHEDVYRSQRQFVNDLVEFCLDTETHVVLVAHPNKSVGSDKGRVQKIHISGSGDIANLAFNVVSIAPVDQGDQQDAVILEVLKNRLGGTTGRVPLDFDPTWK